MINIILWILMGALAGWIASMIMKTDGEMGALANIVVGIIGAFIGGFVFRFLGTGVDADGFNITSLIVAVVGAIILLAIMKAIGGRSATV